MSSKRHIKHSLWF